MSAGISWTYVYPGLCFILAGAVLLAVIVANAARRPKSKLWRYCLECGTASHEKICPLCGGWCD
jgi:hypothetical protein